jgi:nitrogen-specific signal transduction histidine kinase
MKLDFFLFIFALMLAFLTGNITYSLKSDSKGDFRDLENIRALHLEMQEELNPYKRLDLNIDYPSDEHLKLLTEKLNIHPSKSFIFNSTECLRTKLNQLSSDFINKETLWMAYLCNQLENLPLNFFKTPPFMSKKGHSFSFMRFKMFRNQPSKITWLEKNAKYMHIEELTELHWPTTSNQRFLINLPKKTLNNLLKGENIFFTDQFYFIKNGNLKYFVLETKKVDRFFNRTKYSFDKDNKGCIFKTSSICWKKTTQNLQNFLTQSIVVLFIGTIIILALTANSFFSRLRRKKLEEERKKHALRVLTHELRTPIASLLVHGHSMQKFYEKIPIEAQEELAKIEGQIYRLKHLAEKSQGYLQTDDQKLIHLQNRTIPSINEFLGDIVLEYNNSSISFTKDEDTEIETDPYWLKLCITNLIENALRYGKAPIIIQLFLTKDKVQIDIIDKGLIKYSNIKDLLKAKHTDSIGLGMGLTIVNKTICEMKGKLLLKPNPTTFSLIINKKAKDKNEQ